jgi:predicted Zn finger-like uncharacterized protein
MALATQCPQCLTIFRVANDQLKLRGGLVRCGSCKNVFNGNEFLVEAGISDGLYHPAPGSRALPPGAPVPIVMAPAMATPAADTVPIVNTPAPIEAAPAPLPTPPLVSEPIPLQREPKVFRSPDNPGYVPDLRATLPAADAGTPDDFPLPSKPSAPEDEGDVDPGAASTDIPAAELPHDETDVLTGSETETASETEPEPDPESEPEPAPLDDLGFVKKAERRARVGHVTQIVMILLAAVMVPLLLLQATYYWRNQIAAGAPVLRPMLNGMCATFNCTVGVPAEIDQLSLESNELQVVPPNQNIYALSLLLRNRSTSDQAWPAIELTLNNDDEKPVVRRVFRPREYLPATQQIDNGIGAGSEQLVKLTFELDNALVSGYRIYLFYP